MNASELAIHLQQRKAQADKICAAPEKFKVCEQCFSIAFKQARICPICHAYRFHDDPRKVEKIARICEDSPFPRTAAVAPRLREVVWNPTRL